MMKLYGTLVFGEEGEQKGMVMRPLGYQEEGSAEK